MQGELYKGLRRAFWVTLALVLLAFLLIKFGNAQTQIAPFSTTQAISYQQLSTNINGEMFPAQCGASKAPPWCTGSTPNSWFAAACAQLPSTGGIINLLGLKGSVSAPMSCSTSTKQVITIFDPTSPLTITETDGGITFPEDNGSAFIGPGVGQCTFGGGIHLASTANIKAVVGPNHLDRSQENFQAGGLCMYGATGATVTQALIYDYGTFANTTLANNGLFICNTACMKIEDAGGVWLNNNWANVSDGNSSITGTPLIIQGDGLGSGCNVGPVTVIQGQYEHALGGGPEIDVKGDGTGFVLACDIHIRDVGIERNNVGSASVNGISVADCRNCSVENVIETGVAGGTNEIAVIQNLTINATSGSIENFVAQNIDNLGSYTNTLTDNTPNGTTIPFAQQPYITTYYANPGYVQAPVLPGTTLQAVGSDLLGGYGNFATGSGTFGTNFGATGCLSGQGYTCTYTRTNATAPPGSTYSQEVQITTNTSASLGFDGIQYVPAVSFSAGHTYVATFWGKGDGTFTGLPSFYLGDTTVPTNYCLSVNPTPFTTTWTIYSFICQPTSSASSYVAAAALATPVNVTGTFWIGDFTFAEVQPLTPNSILSSVTPFGIGPATTAQITTTINGVPCVLGTSCSAGGGVPTVNTIAHPLVISYSAGAGSCSDSGTIQTCTFTGSSTGGGSVTNFIAGTWPSWLTPSVATSTTTPTLSVTASGIPNSALTNSSFTLGSTSISLGATATGVTGLTCSSCTFVTPALGTPASGVLTNTTGYPWSALVGSPSTTQVPFQSLTTTGTSGPATLAGGVLNIPQYATSGGSTNTICSGTITLGTSAIASGAAASTVTATCSGLASTDNIQLDFNGNPLSVTGFIPSSNGMLTIIKWPTTNTINVSVVNNTGASITPGAVTLNYRVVR